MISPIVGAIIVGVFCGAIGYIAGFLTATAINKILDKTIEVLK